METIVKLANPIGELDSMKIYVDYCKGGSNFFNGKSQKRGVIVGFKPVKITPYGYICHFTSDTKENGFTVNVKELGRRSAKWEEKVFNSVLCIKESLTELYEQNKFNEMVNYLKLWC